MRRLDLTNHTFGCWTALACAGIDTHGKVIWRCRCDCGNYGTVPVGNLRSGGSTQCLECKWKKVRRTRQLRPYEALYRSFVRNAAHEVLLTYGEFLSFTGTPDCHYCGAPLVWAESDLVRNGAAYNLDRKDNSLPYTYDNCVPCCTRCNIGKSRFFTYAEWKQLGDVIRSWKK